MHVWRGGTHALQPLVVDAALNYLAVLAAQRMGFVELRRYLQSFVDSEDKVKALERAAPAPFCPRILILIVAALDPVRAHETRFSGHWQSWRLLQRSSQLRRSDAAAPASQEHLF
jgi:hypothetical protein